jgi:hypothetical protein
MNAETLCLMFSSGGPYLTVLKYSDTLLLFITAVPNTKLCAWGEEDSGGHVL